MIFQYGLELVLIQRILIGFEAILKIFLKTVVLKLQVRLVLSEDSNKTLFFCISIRNLMRAASAKDVHMG